MAGGRQGDLGFLPGGTYLACWDIPGHLWSPRHGGELVGEVNELQCQNVWIMSLSSGASQGQEKAGSASVGAGEVQHTGPVYREGQCMRHRFSISQMERIYTQILPSPGAWLISRQEMVS